MRTISKIAFSILVFSSLLFSAEKIREKDLALKYQEWLNLTRYIILPQEKQVFFQLTTDRDRDIFIETFWKQRDPTPGTPQNEYREEHIKRFNYVNVNFKRGSSREGWMTDQGRFYILLGPASSIERLEMEQGLHPIQVWYYYGDKEKGLPAHFALVFFKKGSAGEYRLYDPIADGPDSLLIESKNLDPFDYEELYNKIQEFSATLALVSLSMIPGDIPYGYQPSTQNAIFLANIIELPKRDVNPSYATHFLNYKGIVSTEYMTNFVAINTSFALIKDPITGLNFLHFTLAPETVSIDYYEPNDKYFCNFSLTVSLRVEEEIIFQYTKEFPLYFSPDELGNIRSNGIAIEDTFPVIEGAYKLTVLLQNSVGKEFSLFEKDVGIPEESELPPIIGPFVGYGFENYDTSRYIPFKVLDKKLLVDPKNTLSTSDTIALLYVLTNISESVWRGGKVNVLIKGLREQAPSVKTLSEELKNYPFHKVMSLTHTIQAKELSPDYYEVKVSFFDAKGKLIAEQTANFIISPEQALPHPNIRAKSLSLSSSYAFYYMLAEQYEKVNDEKRAEAFFQRAYELKPDYFRGLTRYALFLLKVKKFDKALTLAEKLREVEGERFNYFLVRGLAFAGKGEYAKAVESLLEGNKIYNSDTRLLNSLGFSYYKIGRKREALEALKASLSLNPAQTEVKALIEEIEKSLR